MRKRVKLLRDAAGAWRVDLPTYRMIEGTFGPVAPGLIHPDGIDPKAAPAAVLALGPTVEVECPDAYSTDGGRNIDAERIREIYSNHADWSRAARAPDI